MNYEFSVAKFLPEDLLQKVYRWYELTPEVLKVNWQFDDNFENFSRDLKKGETYLGKKDGILTAMVYGDPKTTDIVEGHLFCAPNSDIDFLTMMVTYAKAQALTKYKTVLTQTIVKHKTMLEINRRSGFVDTGYRSWSGVYRGQLLEVQHNIAV